MLKKEFTSFDVAAAVQELKSQILDSRVNNIYQPDSRTLLLKLHKTDRPALRLILEAGKRLHLTNYVLEKPSTPPAFCMALRKYLRNARITSIEQHEFERVILISFTSQMGKLQLVLELFGDGNIILINEKGSILQALLYKRMRDRSILREEPFKFAPSTGKNPFKINGKDFHEGLKAYHNVEIVRAVTRVLSIGGVYAEEVLLRANIDKNKKVNTLHEHEIEAIFNSIQGLLTQVNSTILEPCVITDKSGSLVDVLPLRLKRYEIEGLKLQPYTSFNEALDEYYTRASTIEKSLSNIEVDKLTQEAERFKRIIADQEKVLAEAEVEAQQNKRIGDTIYAHASDLQVLIDKFLTRKRTGKEWKTIISETLTEKQAGLKSSSYFESFDPKNLCINVRADDSTFGLSLRKTVFEEAARFYEQGKRAKQKLDGAKTALLDSRTKLNEVEARMREVHALELEKPESIMEELTKRKVKHKEWFEKFRWFVSSDGFMVIAGRDAVTNEVLIKKYTENNDTVFHADVLGAPFVVVKTESRKPSEQCLREAAEFAAAFSRGWREGFASIDVYWVKPDQLSKGGSSGESVPHGAFIVRGERNWMRGVPLRTAIGITTNIEKGSPKIVGGPVDAVKAKSKSFVVVVPDDFSGKELFEHILKILAGKTAKEHRKEVSSLSSEEMREFIPYGKGAILQK